MYLNEKLLIGKNKDYDACIIPKMANRHGLITGASGTGKTTTVKVLAESFSSLGVPVFVSDVKGDLSGCAVQGGEDENVKVRVEELGLTNDFEYRAFPTRFWDLYQQNGHAIRVSIYDIGPQVLSIILGLSEVQEGVLTIIYRIAHDEGKMIYDIEDLRTLLSYVGEKRSEYSLKYGNITTQSIGVIQRSLLALEDQGADKFFGEPSFDINDLLKTKDEMGYINILHAVELFNSPDLYASFLLYLLMRLYKDMPEVGDLEKPKLVFFFDEAHLLFNNMPEYRLKFITQIVKLIRSKGIGLYFISQQPSDIPNEILSQLSNRIQHALRAYTPNEQRNVKVAADSFRVNPKLKTYDEILNLKTGEALVSFLNENGEPEVVNKVRILPPESKMGVIDDMSRNKIINNSEFVGKYEEKQEMEDAAHLVLGKIREEEAKVKEEQEAKIEEEKRLKEEEKQKKLEEKEELERQKEEARIKKEEQKALLEKQKEEARIKREEERARKNSVGYKLGKKVANKTADKLINKGLNSIFKNLFK